MALLFLISGWIKLTQVAALQGYMAAFGVPVVLIWPAAVWEIGTGLLLLIGLWTRPVAFGLAGWCVLTAAIFHTAFGDLMNFFKNLTMAGGFLMLAKSGSRVLSVDALLEGRARNRGWAPHTTGTKVAAKV